MIYTAQKRKQRRKDEIRHIQLSKETKKEQIFVLLRVMQCHTDGGGDNDNSHDVTLKRFNTNCMAIYNIEATKSNICSDDRARLNRIS
jgi:hypothetical protein